MRTTSSLSGEPSSSNVTIPNQHETTPLLHSRRKEKSPARSQDNYGTASVLPDNIQSDRPQHDEDDADSMAETTPQCRRRLCVAFVFLMGLSGIAAVLLLLLTPEFAQRSFEDGVQFEFHEASIINGSQHDLSMHVAGQITLRDDAYSLVRKATWIFGNNLGIRDSRLQVYQSSSAVAMGMIDLPPLTLEQDSSITPFDFTTHFTVTDDGELIKFAQNAVSEKRVSWTLNGPLALKLGWFGADVDLTKQIFLEGMDGLKQADIKSVSFPGTHPLGGIALQGEVGIFNPSKMLGLRLGDIDFGIFLPGSDGEDKMIAVVQANDANLLGGQLNVFSIHGRSLPLDDHDQERKELMEKFLSAYLHGNTSTVYVRGSPFGPDDRAAGNTPEWLRKALESLTLQVPFPGTQQTDLIRSLEMTHIKIDFSNNGNPLISGDIDAFLKMPNEMQFAINVTEIDPKVFLYLEADSTSPFGRLTSNRPCPAQTIPAEDKMIQVSSRLNRAPFEVLPGKDKEFQKFLDRIFHGRRGTVYIKGTADAQVKSAFGELTVRDLEFKGQIDTKGMQGMKNPPPRVTSIALKRGYPDALHIVNDLVIENPSDVLVNLGQVTLMLLYKDEAIGEVTVPELKLQPEANNTMAIEGRLIKKADNARMVDFIGSYISGDEADTQLTISGRHPEATQSPLLKTVIQSLVFDVTPPRFNEEPLLAAMQMNVLSSTTVLWLRNPFHDIGITMIKVNATASYKSHEIGSAQANFSDRGEGWSGPLALPPVSCDRVSQNCSAIVVETPKIPVMTKKLGFEAIKKALGGEIEVSVHSVVAIKIDELLLDDLLYERDNLTAKISKGF